MPLIKSISGIRGTIGGLAGNNLTPIDIVSLISAYGQSLHADQTGKRKVVIGRDGRLSGPMVSQLVSGALLSQGIDVIDLGMASSPTVEMTVLQQAAQGGIIITASHNLAGWNALKLLSASSEIISAVEGEKIYSLASGQMIYVPEESIGKYSYQPELAAGHIQAVLAAPLVDQYAIRLRKFKIVIDGINSVGGVVMPQLLHALGVDDIILVNCDPTGVFAHPPEPLADNLVATAARVKESGADLGIVVDPDVDRLAFIDENGVIISEEYTLVAVANYVLENFAVIEKVFPGLYDKTTSSNLSSTRALKDIALKHGGRYEAAPVGEINVASVMKKLKAYIGGEGNGGVICAGLHYGRDALVGVALYLSALARSGLKISEFQGSLPVYAMIKDKISLEPGIDLPAILKKIAQGPEAAGALVTTVDGLKLDWEDSWVHLRASNTEPIIRVYAEALQEAAARQLVEQMKDKISAYIN